METIYKTEDGKQFNTAKEAKDHEKGLKEDKVIKVHVYNNSGRGEKKYEFEEKLNTKISDELSEKIYYEIYETTFKLAVNVKNGTVKLISVNAGNNSREFCLNKE